MGYLLIFLQKAFNTKSKLTIDSNSSNSSSNDTDNKDNLHKTLSLFDLICVGVGGTVGSGVFVLSGFIASEYCGSAAPISWLIAGICCLFSASSYAELSIIYPSAGSAYQYCYYSLGEWPANIAAWCLTLEYGISGSAVARSWGDKISTYIVSINGSENGIPSIFLPNSFGIFGAVLQLLCILVLLGGVEIGKITVNFFTLLKMMLIVFIIIAGLALFKQSNIHSGMVIVSARGILKGAAPCFFGYVGYDEVCCLAGEAKDPVRTLPLAVFGTIIIVTIVYVLSSIALVGMQNYASISKESGFSEGFRSRGLDWARHTVAIGEILTLPLVVLVSFLAQPRLFYAMAQDGQLPSQFSKIDSKGNLKDGIILSGIACTVIAFFVPFQYLDELISTGVLISFNLTNASLIILRNSLLSLSSSSSSSSPHLASSSSSSSPSISQLMSSPSTQTKSLLLVFNITCLLVSYILTNLPFHSLALLVFTIVLVMIFLCITFYAAYHIYMIFMSSQFASSSSLHNDKLKHNHYMTPFMPFTPLIGTVINCILISQISTTGILITGIYFFLASIVYFLYGLRMSKLNCIDKELEFITVSNRDDDVDDHDHDLVDNSIDYDLKTYNPVITNSKMSLNFH